MVTAYDTCPDCWHDRLKHREDRGCTAEDGGCKCVLTPAAVTEAQTRRALRGNR